MLAAGVLCAAVAALLWLGWVATSSWRHQTQELVERQEAEALALTAEALSRDMRGVWSTMLTSVNEVALDEDPPFDLLQLTAKAFARFPYPESFVVWRNADSGETTFAFNRTERPPAWDSAGGTASGPFPVALRANPPHIEPLIAQLRQVPSTTPFALTNIELAGVPYQVVAHVFFSPTPPYRVSTIVAFTVNMDWVRREYFQPLIQQLARIGGNTSAVSLVVQDEQGRKIAQTEKQSQDGRIFERRFELAFLDPRMLPRQTQHRIPQWTLSVRPAAQNALLPVQNASLVGFSLIALAAMVSAAAMLLTARAVRANAVVASMKTEFVTTVTHELKTPVALVRLVGDTLARGRYHSTDTIEEYAGLLSQCAARLSHSIDSLLTYSRYTDVLSGMPPHASPVDVSEVIDDALEEFRPLLGSRGFDLTVDVPETLPSITADRRAIVQVFASVIDNAIKYSTDSHTLKIVGRATGSVVRVTISDQGEGIPEHDIARVFERFYRGKNVRQGGSGLGLTIAQRIVNCHRGHINIRSVVGVGTDVELTMPAAV